jgi:hemolysin III
MHYDESSTKPRWYPRHPGVVILDTIGVIMSVYWLTVSVHWTTDIYIFTLAMLYIVSGLYHYVQDRTWLGKLDHIMIFYVIAVTALPYWGHIIPLAWYPGGPLVIIMVCIMGTVVKTLKDLPRFISGFVYVLASLPMVIYFIINFEHITPPYGSLWMIGIVLYSIQLGVYTLKKPNPFNELFGYREIQHIVLLMATNLHTIIAINLTTP